MDPTTPDEWARTLKDEWEERARSASRDFFIASHAEWNRPDVWDRQAAIDASWPVAWLDRAKLADDDVLEVGCGVGRLVPYIAPLVRSYTGFDVACGHVAEARRRSSGFENVRFFESDGLGIPAGASDRKYGLIFAHAVFIHCPRVVIESLIRAAIEALGPDGELRFQLAADTADLDGIQSIEASESARVIAEKIERFDLPDRHLMDERHYAGERFTFSAAREFVEGFGLERADVFRFDRAFIYGRLVNRG